MWFNSQNHNENQKERKDSMTKWKEMLHKEQKYLQELLNQLEKQEKRNLAGRLRISSDRGYPRYYHCKGDDKRGVYISKKNLELARQLAQKEYDEKLQKYIAKRLKQVGKILKSDTEEEIDEVYETLHEARKQLVTPIQPTWEQQLEQWKKESYQGKESPGDSIVIYTEKGERVRSKSEKILADYFYHKGIPYQYEKPLLLQGFGVVYPDFTFLSPRTRREIYWEHDGKMDDPAYAKSAVRKIDTYQKNGIYPGENLILTFETSDMPLGTRTIQEMVRRFLV